MKIPPQPFFNFCADHVPLLRELARQEGEVSEAGARRLIQWAEGRDGDHLDTTWKRLRDFQILVPTEAGSDFYRLADPVSRLLAYLFDEAQAATPEIIQGYIQSLESLDMRLSRAIDADDPVGVSLALEELQPTLRRIQSDVAETHHSVLAAVAAYKSECRNVSVREKFRRMTHWMDRYVDPMADIVRVDGLLHATFDETERLLLRAHDQGLLTNLSALERHTRHLRVVSRQALRAFQQCRRELQPLYDSLRRSSFIAEGAAIALERLQSYGLDSWISTHVVSVCDLRLYYSPSDAAINRAVRNLLAHKPEPAPVLALDTEETTPDGLGRQQWLEDLAEELRAALPVPDLLGWMTGLYPDKSTADTLTGFTRLVFASDFVSDFTDGTAQTYKTRDGMLLANPVEVTGVTLP